MSPRVTARLLLVAAAALLSACSNPLAPTDTAVRAEADTQAACSGVFGGVSTRCITYSDTTTTGD